ncbi:MAG: hypothetical protein JXC32_12455 [Anaerolineae bacterium]|nr:hypothetical protein [Anaerolineae bacterium]
MNKAGVVLLGEDQTIAAKARNAKLGLKVCEWCAPPFAKTLYVAAGTQVPWDLLPAAWHFLERWDAAVPLWRYGVNACDVGSKEERKRTQAIVRDLRVLLHSHELLFVRNNNAGHALIDAFLEELEGSDEPRLAFLRAFYRVKPRLCVLPRSWLAEIHQRSIQDARSRRVRSADRAGVPLVQVEISPGSYVQCYKGDEDKVREMHQRGRRGGRR